MIQSFFPPHRILMGPGPSDVSSLVLAALAVALSGQGHNVDSGAALAAAKANLAD